MSRTLILIVDPSAASRDMYGDGMRHYGFDIVEAADRLSGLRQACRFQPDVIVTELFDDVAWVRRLRVAGAHSRTCVPRIIACSSLVSRHEVRAAALDVYDAVLAHPASPRNLLLTIERLLADAQPVRLTA
jgi:CheY-like chemotaxis protein